MMRHVAFIHPDLGIGGAEQLVVLAGLGLKNLNTYNIHMFTSHHDPTHCFEETRNGTLSVTQYGDWLPRTLFGYGTAYCSICRMFWIFIRLFLYKIIYGTKFDIIIVDQVSAINPFYRLLCSKLIFYCHFPDLLLCTQRQTLWKKLYRNLLDRVEEKTIGCCDKLLVNSSYTKSVLFQTFPLLKEKPVYILRPPIDLKAIQKVTTQVQDWMYMQQQFPNELCHLPSKQFVLSLNRFEAKKSVHRAIQAMLWFKNENVNSNKKLDVPVLVIAGGYDQRLPENKNILKQLKTLANTGGLEEGKDIIFLTSIPDILRWCLLFHCKAVLYTPSNEHFGIVPIEAMASGVPVIACNSGGPKETILHLETGFLCDDTRNDASAPIDIEFGKALMTIMEMTNEQLIHIRQRCIQHVNDCFTLDAFSKTLDSLIDDSLTLESQCDKKKV